MNKAYLFYMNFFRLVAFCFLISIRIVIAQSGPYKIVVLGSSTSEGYGASPGKNWTSLYQNALKKVNSDNQIINLAKSGYSTIQLMPDGINVPGFPNGSWDAARNITYALSLSPDAIIINLPANDLLYKVSLEQQQKNLELIVNTSLKNNVPVWVTTVQPRIGLNTVSLQYQLDMKKWIQDTFKDKAIDVWTPFAEANGSLKNQYAFTDKVHLNDAGHALFFKLITEVDIPRYLSEQMLKFRGFEAQLSDEGLKLSWRTCLERGVEKFNVEKSKDSSSWYRIGVVNGADSSNAFNDYWFIDTNDSAYPVSYYRLFVGPSRKKKSLYSKIIQIDRSNLNPKIYPNPVDNYFKISGLTVGYHVLEIFDLLGKLIYKDDKFTGERSVNVERWVKGVYFMRLDRKITRAKIIKQ